MSPAKEPRRSAATKTFAKVAERFKSFAPARGVLLPVRAVPTIFSQYDFVTRVGGHPLDRVTVVTGPSNHGKAQPTTEPVLTPTGWRPIGELKVGDEVVSSSGTPARVTGVFPQGKKPVFRISTDDGASALSCEEHLWFTTTEKELNRGRYTRGPRPERVRIPTGKEGDGSVKTLAQIRETLLEGHYLPRLSAPVVFERAGDLPLEPYFFGLLLGDASFVGGGVTFTKPDEELLRTVEERAVSLGDKATRFSRGDRCPGVRISGVLGKGGPGSNTMKVLEGMGLKGCLSPEKFVPKEYLFASPAERLALLQGLMDTDGGTGGTQAQFSTASPLLRDAVVELVRSLAGRALAYPHPVPEGCAPAWCVMISFDSEFVPFRLKRKAEAWKQRKKTFRPRVQSVEPNGEAECICIAVDAPDHLYVTRGHIVTHNTLFCNGLLLSFLKAGHFAALIDAEQTTTSTWLETLMAEQVDNPAFVAARTATYEDAVTAFRSFARSLVEARESGELPAGTGGIVVVDSISKLIPQNLMKELEKEEAKDVDGAGGRAGQIKAAKNAAWLDEMTYLCAESGITAVLIARETTDPNASMMARAAGTDYKIKGGGALTYDSSLVLRVTHSWVQEGGGEGEAPTVFGERHCVQVLKTKVAGKDAKKPKAYFHSSNGRLIPEGFDPARDLLELGAEFGVVEKKGTWFSFGEERLGQGANNAVKNLMEHQELLARLDAAVRGKFSEKEPAETGEVEG